MEDRFEKKTLGPTFSTILTPKLFYFFSEFAAKLRRHHDVLCELIEPDFGLVDHMSSYGILSPLAADEINSAMTSCSRNEIILQNIINCDDRSKHDAFLAALTHTRQQHIVNFIKADGGKLCVQH